MLADAGGIACSFNSTVYAENVTHVPAVIQWAQEHIDIVNTMVFICFRHVVPEMPFDWYAGGDKVPWNDLWYHSDESREVTIRSNDLVARVREEYPDFAPAAYLNGTKQADSFKWLLTERVGSKDRIYGYVGPKFVELVSAAYHFWNDRYLSYVSPKTTRAGRASMLLLWPFDSKIRRAAANYLGSVLRNPLRLFRRAHLQSIMFIQPVDFLSNGEQSMCDGCPDVTVHEGELVWSCRLEELKQFGTFLRSVPRAEAREESEVAARSV
jgi:hypothetical protein